jgi:hypothetical protein
MRSAESSTGISSGGVRCGGHVSLPGLCGARAVRLVGSLRASWAGLSVLVSRGIWGTQTVSRRGGRSIVSAIVLRPSG